MLDKYAFRVYNNSRVRRSQTFHKGGDILYPNLLGQKLFLKLSNEEMAKIIGVSRRAYEQKIRSGRFTPKECTVLCRYFQKPFDYLFASEDDLPTSYSQ